jgi:hypothetical protein
MLTLKENLMFLTYFIGVPKIVSSSLFDFFLQVEAAHCTEVEEYMSLMLKCFKNVNKQPLPSHFWNYYFLGESMFVF